MPGIKITDEDRQRIPAYFICTLCKLLLYIPMQTSCGHLMCQSCIENLLRNPNPRCPVDGEELSEEKVHADALKKRELNALEDLNCPNSGCVWISGYEQFELHSRVCEHSLVKCVHPQCQIELQRMKLQLQSILQTLTGLENRVEGVECSGGGDATTRLRNEVQELKSKLRELTALSDCLVSKMDQMNESLAMNTVRIADLESQRGQVIHSHNGTLLWKIEGYQRKRQDAINGVTTALYSPPFYSAQYGYKMCAKIYMNGDGFGKGSHLSLFFVVMRGDYDAIQTWPFQKKITMMLLDQGNGDHMIDAFNSDPQSSSFQRPKSDMNIASGSPLFLPLGSLNNRQYIKDDVMFIKVIVD